MKKRNFSFVLMAGVLGGMCSAALANPAATYPNKPIKIIVPFPAGGTADVLPRIIGQKLNEKWGQPVLIENRAGAGGNIGAEAVYHAPADGYTLMASSGSPLSINGYLYKKLYYEPEGFEPISILSQIPTVLVVRPDFPAKDIKEFLAYVKANPGKLTYASQGVGTASHLTGELFMHLTGAKLTHVPYKGTSPALNDLIAGHVDMTFIQSSNSFELYKSGRAKILAAATDKRIDILPEIPTLGEAGLPQIISRTWNAISAPPQTPMPVLVKLNKQIDEILAEPDVKAHFEKLQITPVGGNLEETKKYVEEDRALWGKVVTAAGLQPQ
jgi:tripartite-type tricarboxylate transporter receptor subunit TctC